ncbi:MAG: hypothetical protein DMF62_04650 [Acidobacteria bacterium]|nr:MAG: hypothetical protein DMF62_04650 [Acidobacteriota bacterium]
MAESVTKAVMDFTNVKEGGGQFNKLHQRAGGYPAVVVKVQDAPSKKDDVMQWLFTIKVGAGQYPYYCKHVENQLWKVRNIFVAAGITIPKKRVKVDPNLVVGKKIGVILEDDEYDGKVQSNIQAIVPLAELDDIGTDGDDDDVDDEADTEDDVEEEAPVAKKAAPKAKAKAAPVVEDDDDDDLEEIEIEEL